MLVQVSESWGMERSLYENALMLDPVLAVTVQEALQDGRIDRGAAVLAWRLVRSGPVGCKDDP